MKENNIAIGTRTQYWVSGKGQRPKLAELKGALVTHGNAIVKCPKCHSVDISRDSRKDIRAYCHECEAWFTYR